MTGKHTIGFYPIKGKVLARQDQQLYSHADTVTQTVEKHLIGIGMRDVRRIPPDLIAFSGGTGTPVLKSPFGLEENVDSGIVRIRTEGPTLAAYYYISFLGRFSIRWFIPVGLITLLAYFEAALRLLILPFIAIVLTVPLVFTVFIIRWGMKKELIRAFQTAEKMIGR